MYPILAITSDVHVDLYNNPHGLFMLLDKPEHKDMILCLAGDIVTDTKPEMADFKTFLCKCAKYFSHVVWVAGNHDLWGYDATGNNSFDEQVIALNLEHSNIHYLTMDDTVVIDGIEFWGHTFWTNVEKSNEVIAIQGLNDFQNIHSFDGNDFYVHQMNSINQQARKALKKFLTSPKDNQSYSVDKRVVMTHFPLFRENVQENPNPYDIYYDNHMDYELAYMPLPDLFIHGHTHNHYDYDFMGSRVVCHPRGYPSQSQGYQLKYVDLNEK